ncbi:MAG: ATP-dependent helicase HrpB [Bradymonadia bacterium]|jgi:ATP-dependent helicase HrpB
MRLPIDALRSDFDAAYGKQPIVLSAPTGSGKSTQVPRWCAVHGRVLVVEPRRVACRSLAERVAHLEGTSLGTGVGYRVRDDNRSTPTTRILFATPGVVLRMLAEGLDCPTLIIDEFHERSLDTDLLLALGQTRYKGQLVIMSATLAGDRIATHLGGVHLAGEGRTFPVDISYLPTGDQVRPDDHNLGSRIKRALAKARPDGDVLVFLPGRGEISRVCTALRGAHNAVPLHGGLSLDEQRAAFAPTDQRKIVVATNVAETSLTIPKVRVVIDAGLVRRTRYRDGRGYLTLMGIAQDSADQRAGRAGRTAAGQCIRLWSQRARLDERTPPEMYRESLVPLLLAAAANEADMDTLPFLDPPKPYALDAARAELRALGALADGGSQGGAGAWALTERGRALFHLPLDAALGRLLVEAEGTPVMDDMIDLVAVLAVDRPLFAHGPPPEEPSLNLRERGCDVTAAIEAVRRGDIDAHRLRAFTVQEARRVVRRLRRAFGLKGRSQGAVDRRALALCALAADRRLAHVARRRNKRVAWSNGGTELNLGRDSALGSLLDTPEGKGVEAALIFSSRAVGKDERQTELLATCVMPVPMPWLVAANIGRPQVRAARRKRGRQGATIVATVDQVHAGKVIASHEAEPKGEAARAALVKLLSEGRLFKEQIVETRDRLEAQALHARLNETLSGQPPPPDFDSWLTARVDALGFEAGRDLALLSPEDFAVDGLSDYDRAELDRLYPRSLDYGGSSFTVTYDLRRRAVTLTRSQGTLKTPPPLTYLPSFRGFKIVCQIRNITKILRERR